MRNASVKVRQKRSRKIRYSRVAFPRGKIRPTNSMSVASNFVIGIVLLTSVATGEIIKDELAQMNRDLSKINAIAAQLEWKDVVTPGEDYSGKRLRLSKVHAEWRNSWCRKLGEVFEEGLFHSGDEIRQFYLLCRGPKHSPENARELTDTVEKLRKLYQKKVCRKDGTCLSIEPDLRKLMATSRDPEILLWAWIEWRNVVGEPSRELYTKMVELMNLGAMNNGYSDIGECWREELESDDLEELAEELYAEVKPLYTALHAVVRFKLNRFYGSDLVSLEESIPAHLTGNMWGQNWASLVDLILEGSKSLNVTEGLRRKRYTVTDLVKRAEDFYTSLGFPPMTRKFWENSKLSSTGNDTVCQGSAINMHQHNDFRMLLCADVTAEDLKVIIHEMGHIQYFMEYETQPEIFQTGTNSAFQEAIGEAIAYGVISPNHLTRLGLIQDVESSGIDLRLLLEQALSKLPEIPFALAIEKWRWGVFRGDIPPARYNHAWWLLRERYQGVKPPVPRSEEFFDPAAKFHINDNTPYIRYFLSSILQLQIFESLCKGAIYGRDRMNDSLPIPLHRCDIYGSKDGTEKLREIMSFGSRIHWSEALEAATGHRRYSTRALLTYYRPLYKWLVTEIAENNIPVGW